MVLDVGENRTSWIFVKEMEIVVCYFRDFVRVVTVEQRFLEAENCSFMIICVCVELFVG